MQFEKLANICEFSSKNLEKLKDVYSKSHDHRISVWGASNKIIAPWMFQLEVQLS